jgi:hypothetical protein
VWRSTEKQQDGAVIATFVDSTSELEHEITLTCRIKDTPAKNGSRARRDWTVTHNTWTTDTDSVTGEVVYEPFKGFTGGSFALMGIEAADIRDYEGNKYGLLWTTLTSKVPDTGIIGFILHGLPKLYDN